MPPENKWSWLIWWLFLLVISLETLVIIEMFETIDIGSFLLWILGTILSGVIIAVIILVVKRFLQSVLSSYPRKLFKTQFGPNRYVFREKIGETLILRFRESGVIYGYHFFVESKKLIDDIERIGIRPQAKILWLKSWLKEYNSNTSDIDENERDNPPIRIVYAEDVTHPSQITQRVIDDGACGKWLYYAPAIKIKPNSEMVFRIDIQVNKPWKGYTDFRLETIKGRRVAHHPVILNRVRKKSE